MRRQTDDKVAVEIVSETKKRFPALTDVSLDKGFHSKQNQRDLEELLDLVVLPKKGRLGEADRQKENSPEFKLLRRRHSAVESAINALEVHGLDQCPDHGIDENTNGLIRQYLPKGTDFQTLTHEEVQDIMDKLNNRPRKCLGFKTPNQLFFGIKPPVALAS